MEAAPWYQIKNVEEIDSPALLIYPERVEENLRRMIATTGGPERLWPHVKTHKLAELTRRQIELGITKFKCATIAEAEMIARAGAKDVLLAYQPVGPKIKRLLQLQNDFPNTRFSTIADSELVVRALSQAATQTKTSITVFVDIDCGMKRTGIPADAGAFELYQLIANSPGLVAGGLHTYDGHASQTDHVDRERACEESFAPVQALADKLARAGMTPQKMIVGGTPTFPMHAKRAGVDCSPGTCVLWDGMSVVRCPDMDFLPAALVLTRVVSLPGANRLCLDLGHKAIASENPHPRVLFLNLPGAKAVSHSEEHLVVETARAAEFPIGSAIYGIPWHVCPTVALHAEAIVVRGGVATEKWAVEARSRFLSI
jgi:D-serine deaminase-like pyridoxal phosphate-dependent protein